MDLSQLLDNREWVRLGNSDSEKSFDILCFELHDFGCEGVVSRITLAVRELGKIFGFLVLQFLQVRKRETLGFSSLLL